MSGKSGLITIFIALMTQNSLAGMTSIVLTDLAEARFEVISFFVLAYLVLTFVVKLLWNSLAKGLEWLPRISFWRSLCLMLVSGLFMYVILTMISGARELMTPGAWEKEGISYRLKADGGPQKQKISALKKLLWDYADEHDGRFPKTRFDPAIPNDEWKLPDYSGHYSYLPPEAPGKLLVFEPASVGKKRFVILEDGTIERWTGRKINREIKSK